MFRGFFRGIKFDLIDLQVSAVVGTPYFIVTAFCFFDKKFTVDSRGRSLPGYNDSDQEVRNRPKA